MQFTVPAHSPDELAAAYLQLAITLGLAGLFGYLYVKYRKPYFRWFAVAWVLYVLRIGAIVSFLSTSAPVWLYWHQVATGWTALALLWATWVFSAAPTWRWWYLVLLLFPPLWSFVAIYQLDDFLLAAGPAVAFLSGATLWTGWVFFRHHRRVRSPASAMLAVVLLLWGLHHLDYPFLRARGAWNPWGYYLDLLFVLGTGAGILLLVLEDVQRGLGALSSLSAQLQRRGMESELLDTLLKSTLTLSGVRGAAMLLCGDDGDRIAGGVGSCESWVGRAPIGWAAEVSHRALRGGRPEVFAGRHRPDAEAEEGGDGGQRYFAALPVFRGGGGAGALIMEGEVRNPFAALDSQFLVALGHQVGAALENADLDRRLAQRTAALERLAHRMVDQHEAERRRLSRELHDETAQVFSAVRLQIGLAREAAPPELAPRLDRTLELVDAGMRSIRDVTDWLRPSLLDELGLVPAMRAFAEHFRERSGLTIRVDTPESVPAMSEAAELAFYRAMQEGMANVVQHAGATRIEVTLVVEGPEVELRLRDDGRGLPADWSVDALPHNGHNGITGMQERFAVVGGRVAVGNGPGGGVEIVARAPVGGPTGG